MVAQKFFKIGYYALITGLVAVGGLLAVSMLPISGNYKIKIVLSCSMEPAIQMGSIVVVKPAEVYERGDIITFGEDTREKIPISHRIVEMRVAGGEYRFVTKGDANDSPDAREVRESEIIGKVLFSVPYAGFILDIARKPIGFAFLIGIPALAIISDEIAKIWREVRKIRSRKRAGHDRDSSKRVDEEDSETKE
jgi:signal peptidase